MQRPLSGLEVLDFSRLVPGPYCTHLLLGLGARVIKVEDARDGDLLRHMPPFRQGVGAYFAELNAGKESIALDLKRDAGQEIARSLVARCDVVVESFRPGVAARLGVDFEALAACNPRLVYCSISGYGQEGALRDLPGHDLTYAAMAGLLDALFPGQPLVPGVQLVDAATALLAAMRILAALRAAGSGPQHLDVSLAEAARALMPGAVAEARAESDAGPSLMAELRGGARNGLYRCDDGAWLAVSPLESHFWERLAAGLCRDGYLEAGTDLSAEKLAEIFASRSREEWFEWLRREDIPAAPVRTVREAVFEDELPAGVPQHGDQTRAILAELGYTGSQIDRLAAEGSIKTA